MFALDEACFDAPFRFSEAMMRRMAGAKHGIVRLACNAAGSDSPEMREELLGFCIVHLERAQGELFGYVVTLDVDPTARGQGVATALMQSTEQMAAYAGAKRMRLHVYAGNAAAIRLYARLGYVLQRGARGFYGPDLDALVYEKFLSGSGNEL